MAKKGKKRYGQRSSSSELRAEEGFSVRVIGTSAELKNQIHALEELTDAEAGVIRSTGEMKGAFRSFYESLDDDTKKGVTEEIGKLVETLGDLGKEFLKSEQGEKMFDGMSEGVKAFGSTATSIVGGVASGFAAGGPVGAAIGGLTGLVKALGGEWLEANKRIEESNADLARAEAEHYDRMRERRREATSGEIERAYKAELDQLDQQNAALERQRGLRRAGEELRRGEFELQQSRDRSSGKNEADLKAERITFDLNERKLPIQRELEEARGKTLSLERKSEQAAQRRDLIRSEGMGTTSKEFIQAEKEASDAAKEHATALAEEEALAKESISRRVKSQYDAERETVEFDREARDSIGRKAENLRGELKRRKEDGSLSKEGENSLSELDSVLGDKNVGRNEVGRVKAAIDGLKNSRDAADRAVIEGMQEISSLSDGYTRSIQKLVTEMNNQRQQIQWLAGKLKTSGDAR